MGCSVRSLQCKCCHLEHIVSHTLLSMTGCFANVLFSHFPNDRLIVDCGSQVNSEGQLQLFPIVVNVSHFSVSLPLEFDLLQSFRTYYSILSLHF